MWTQITTLRNYSGLFSDMKIILITKIVFIVTIDIVYVMSENFLFFWLTLPEKNSLVF